MDTVTHPLKKGYRTIRLPLAESEYDRFLSDRAYARTRLDEFYEDFPELFPEAFAWGYALYGFTEPSIKQEICCRRIRLGLGQAVFTIAPALNSQARSAMIATSRAVAAANALKREESPCASPPRQSIQASDGP